MNLWLDDVRPMPDGFDLHAKSSLDAISMLYTHKIEHVSFDHDLGGDDTGYAVALFIEIESALGRRLYKTWAVHSANPVGRGNIKAAMRSADKLLEQYETTGW